MDFEGLSERHPDILKKEYLIECGDGVTLDFGDQKVSIALTRAILRDAFEIEMEIPRDRLCPPVPNRVNYIEWLHEILNIKLVDPKTGKVRDVPKRFRGLDVGIGASCIYPLLGHRMYGWNFVGTDIDRKSFDYAMRNVKRNGFEKHIDLKLVKPDDDLIPATAVNTLDFCMCNPPFFENEDEVSPHPSRTCFAGANNEMITRGGEKEFVSRMIENSKKHGTKLRWYTSMLGKKSSIKALIRKLRTENRVKEIVSSAFVQGQTRRWGLAWSFHQVENSDTERLERLRCYVAESSKRKRKLKERSSRSCLVFEFEYNEIDRVVAKSRVEECIKECAERGSLSSSSSSSTWAKDLVFKWCISDFVGEGNLPGCGLKFRLKLDRDSKCSIHSLSDVTTKTARARGGSAWIFRILCDRIKGDVIRQSRKWKRRRKKNTS